MTDPDKIDTLEKARALSLAKWVEAGELTRKLFEDIGTRCGFCYWCEEQTGEQFSCAKCLVIEYCNKVQKRMTEMEQELFDEIDRTISFIKQVTENDN